MTPLLDVRGVSVRYRDRPLLREATFSVSPGTVTSLVGPSGVGKSTLLRALNRLLEEEEGFERTGKIFFDGRDIDDGTVDRTGLRRSVALIFQRPVIFPISIFQNVLFGVRHLRLAPKTRWGDIAETCLKEAFLWDEVKDRLHRPALELSVGQQQRLAIARTLAIEPRVVLMDEPTASLDVQATRKIEELILFLKKDRAIVLVTHHPPQAMALSDRLLFLHSRQGCGEVVFQGTPEELRRAPGGGLPPYFLEAFQSAPV